MPHGRYILTETVASAVLNAIVGGLFVFVVFGSVASIELWGPRGLAIDLLPTVFMITLMTTIALTIITRRRMLAGAVQPAEATTVLPANPVLRGLLLAIGATIVLVPASVAILSVVWRSTGDWTFTEVLLFKCIYSATLGFLVTPLIVISALRSRARR